MPPIDLRQGFLGIHPTASIAGKCRVLVRISATGLGFDGLNGLFDPEKILEKYLYGWGCRNLAVNICKANTGRK